MPSRGVRLSVRHFRVFCRNETFSGFFSPSSSHTTQGFPYQTLWQYSDGDPLTTASNASGVGKNRDSRPITGFIACCQRRRTVVNWWHIAGIRDVVCWSRETEASRGLSATANLYLIIVNSKQSYDGTMSFCVWIKYWRQRLMRTIQC